jgi:dipeptidyl-peptidase-4
MNKKLFFAILLFSLPFVAISQNELKKITLEDIYKSGKFRTRGAGNLKSMNDGENYTILKNDSLNIYSYKTGDLLKNIVHTSQLVMENDTIPIQADNYTFSPDETKILFSAETERIYRRSDKSIYYIYNVSDKTLSALSKKGKVRTATFSPDCRFVAFVFENNLYLKDIENDREVQITSDGLKNHIINGAPDWVYEEELDMSRAFFWSPDSKKIAFYRFDESHVKEYSLTYWGDLYPEHYNYKYPKAGEANSNVKILVYDLENKTTTEMETGEETDIYIPRIKWSNNPNILSIQWMNRLQNELKILLADVNTGKSEMVFHENNKYYIDITDNLTFLDDNEHFIFTSEQDGYNHIYLYDILGNLEQQITSGTWDVTDLIGVDENKGLVYYISSETSPLQRDLWVVDLNGKSKKRLSEKAGDNRIRFSEQFKYYLNIYSNANQPPVISVHNPKGKLIRIVEDNERLNKTIKEYEFSPQEFFKFQTSDGVTLNGWMIKPPDFNPKNKYPVLMYVYGGPGSQTVRDTWGGGNTWYRMLASNGIIVVSVDNRGTGARGEEFKKMTYLQLGKYETIDQIETAKHLSGLSYVDADRIGIWGWSYGGYLSSLCMTKGADYFNAGIAVAPVTNWRYYDNIYTERFMRTPKENPDGYDDNSPINHVDKLKGQYLIIHGMADDNVHMQNSVDMISALTKANKNFEMLFYPNSNHGIYTGPNTTFHLYNRLTHFIEENLLKKKE